MPEVGEKRSHDEALPTSITDVDADSRELETDSSTDPIAEKLPPIAFPELISVSLEAMEKHGLDRSQPMPSKHRVVCETEAAAERVRAWAEANAFEPRPTEIFHLHGGVPMWGVDVVRTAVPDPQHIHDQARAIVSGIDTISGSEYTTWMGEYPDSP